MTFGIGSRVLAVAMIALAFAAAGCGDGGFNDNGGGGINPTRTATPAGPTRTPTPAPTATGGVTARTVVFAANASTANQGFQLRVAYPTAKGSFRGSADAVACTTDASGAQFIPNDQDNGTLILVFASAVNLPTAVNVTCTFDQTGAALVAGDLVVTVQEVVINGSPGDVTTLTVTPSVT
jgi:hypothetical protein